MAKMKTTQAANRERVNARARVPELLKRFRKAYPSARCTLDFEKPLDLLVATILAAQCTDQRVNIVTKSLFKKYKTPQDYVDAPQAELEKAVQSCGFFRQKSKSIKKTCALLIQRFNGQVPGDMESLLQLNGVGRKTANVLLGECFNTPGIIVDTHCKRVAARLGLTKHEDPAKIEQDLMKIVPQQDWTLFSHYLVFHGRTTCQSRKPNCEQCVVNDLCPYVG